MKSIRQKINKLTIKQKRIIVLWIICVIALIFLILAITLMSIGINDYKTFIDQWKLTNNNQQQDLPNISMFVYGCFFLVMTVLFLIVIVLYGNHTYNKKYIN